MNRLIKALLLCGLVVGTIGGLSYDNSSQSAPFSPAELGIFKSEDYVGSEAFKDCHEDQFKAKEDHFVQDEIIKRNIRDVSRG